MLGEAVVVTAVLAAGYLVGTLPTAVLVGRRTGHDPTAEGSHNPGATNVLRTSGRGAGAAVLAVDLAKGAGPAAAGWLVGGHLLGVAAGAAAVAGHVAPATRGFRGGKGVATAAGLTAVAYPVLALVLLGLFLASVAATRLASVGSLLFAVLLPMGVALGGAPVAEVLVVTAVGAVVVARHRQNIRRLIRREEARLGPGPSPREVSDR